MVFYAMKSFESGRPFELADDGNPITEEQVGVYEDGWHAFTVASQLWGLVDDPREEAIEALQRRLSAAASMDGRPIRLKDADLDEAISLLSGLPKSTGRENHRRPMALPLERVDEIRRRAPCLDLRSSRTAGDLVHAVGEGIGMAISLCNFRVSSTFSGSRGGVNSARSAG